MFGWFKVKRPSDYELVSRVATLIDGIIDQDGLEEFSKDRLSVIITTDFRVYISEPRRARDALVSVPLRDLNLEIVAVRADQQMRHIAVDMAARTAVKRLPISN